MQRYTFSKITDDFLKIKSHYLNTSKFINYSLIICYVINYFGNFKLVNVMISENIECTFRQYSIKPQNIQFAI